MSKQQAKYEARKALKKRIKAEWSKRLSAAKSKFKTKADFDNMEYKMEFWRRMEGYCAASEEVKRYIHSSLAHLYGSDHELAN